jgi:murein DD-endopeptidase MepM/ murein hydrolase activator NlpD
VASPLALALALAASAAAPAGAPPFAPLSVSVAPVDARPGDAVLVSVTGAAEEPAGTVAGRPLAFWRARGEWRALAALPIELPPGPAGAAVEVGGARLEAPFLVVEPGFASRSLTVEPRFVEPPPEVRARVEADRKAFAKAYDRPFSPPRFRGAFGWPRQAGITGRFGDRRVFNGKNASVHYGLDLAGPRGAPIHAANDGEVVLVRDAYLSGKSVVLWHGADVYTIYFHLDRILVSAGAKVKKGQRIGRLGSTGRSTGPHLHWSARVGGLLVDPESLLGFDFAAGTAPPRPARPAAPPPAEAPVEAPPPPPPGMPPDAAAAPPEHAPAEPAGAAPAPGEPASDAPPR